MGGFPQPMAPSDYPVEKSATVNTSSSGAQSIQLALFSYPPLKYQQTFKGKAFNRKKQKTKKQKRNKHAKATREKKNYAERCTFQETIMDI